LRRPLIRQSSWYKSIRTLKNKYSRRSLSLNSRRRLISRIWLSNMRMAISIEGRVLSLALVRVMEFYVIRMRMKCTVEIGMITNTMGRESFLIFKLRT
jgi:hypothetical protein